MLRFSIIPAALCSALLMIPASLPAQALPVSAPGAKSTAPAPVALPHLQQVQKRGGGGFGGRSFGGGRAFGGGRGFGGGRNFGGGRAFGGGRSFGGGRAFGGRNFGGGRRFGGGGRGIFRGNLGPRRHGAWRGNHRHRGHRHHRHRRYYGYGYIPYYGAAYYSGYGYGYGSCNRLRRKAIRTGSSYWWRRYENCLDYSY